MERIEKALSHFGDRGVPDDAHVNERLDQLEAVLGAEPSPTDAAMPTQGLAGPTRQLPPLRKKSSIESDGSNSELVKL